MCLIVIFFEEVWLRESVRLKGISWWHHNKSISTRDNKAAPWSTLESSSIHTCPTWATTWCNKISPLLLIQRKARSISRAINAPCWTWHPNYASVLSSIALYYFYLPSDEHKQTCSQFFAAALRMHHLMHFHSSQHFHAAARPSDKASWLHKEMLGGDSHQQRCKVCKLRCE